MTIANSQLSYHDLSSLQSIRQQASKDQQAGLRQAAEQFEAIFVGMLLSSMRKANEAFEVDGMMNSQTTKFYRDMHDNQLSTELARSGSLGLADLLVQQLSPAVPASPKAAAKEQTEFSLPVAQPARHKVMPQVPADEITKTEAVVAANTAETSDWNVTSPADFIRTLLPAAKTAATALGLDPLALVAQAALETGWGQRMIKTANGENSFNLFGIKANNGWQGETAVVDTLEYRQGVARKEQARFRAYDSPEHSLQDYSRFINNSARYQDAVKVAAQPQAYFTQLQAAGYATDPEYARKVMAVYQSPAFAEARAGLSDNIQEIPEQAE